MVFPMKTLFLLVVIAASPDKAERPQQLNDLIVKIEASEVLYSNVECRYTIEMDNPIPTPNLDPKSELRRSKEEWHVVWRGDRYYAHATHRLKFYDGSQKQWVSEYGFDGKTTRINAQGRVGSISDTRATPDWLSPTQWAVPDLAGFRLSQLLKSSPEVLEHHGCERVETKILGEETIDGIECVKIAVDMYLKGKPAGRDVIWISPKHNHLAVKSEYYAHSFSLTVPWYKSLASDWREDLPGVWLPYRSEHVTHELPLTNPPTVGSTSIYAVKSVSLKPAELERLVSDIKMPENGVIHVLKGEEIIDEWRNEDGQRKPLDDESSNTNKSGR